MFIPILLSLGLMSGTSAASLVKNKLDTCPTTEELYALFKDDIDLSNLFDVKSKLSPESNGLLI